MADRSREPDHQFFLKILQLSQDIQGEQISVKGATLLFDELFNKAQHLYDPNLVRKGWLEEVLNEAEKRSYVIRLSDGLIMTSPLGSVLAETIAILPEAESIARILIERRKKESSKT